jgi:prevent-host-death family protein
VNVSIRDLKNELSAYIRRVRRGERLVVTDRGRPVAEISAAGAARLSTDERLERMAEEGELRLPKPGKRASRVEPSRVRGGPISATVLEDRH